MHTPITRTAVGLFAVGLIFILSGAAVFLAPRFSSPTLGPPSPLPTSDRFSLETEVQVPTAGPLAFRIAKLNVAYPSTMRENETLPVEVAYSVTYHPMQLPDPRGIVSTDPLSAQELGELDAALNLELSSSGFAVEPKTEIARPAKAKLPITEVWTVTPSAEGSRYLLLKVQEENVSGGLAFRVFHRASINGVPTHADTNGVYRLPVTVHTYWGVSRITSSLIGFALAGIGAVLSYPIVVLLLKRRFRLKEKD